MWSSVMLPEFSVSVSCDSSPSLACYPSFASVLIVFPMATRLATMLSSSPLGALSTFAAVSVLGECVRVETVTEVTRVVCVICNAGLFNLRSCASMLSLVSFGSAVVNFVVFLFSWSGLYNYFGVRDVGQLLFGGLHVFSARYYR